MSARGRVLLHTAGHLQPALARSYLQFPVAVPEGAASLVIHLSFRPARSGRYRNLLTISLFDPTGFRGAGHRHAPDQEVIVGRSAATPGFVPGPLTPGEWVVELDGHAILESTAHGVEYVLEVVALPADVAGETFEQEVPPAAPVQSAAPAGMPGRPNLGNSGPAHARSASERRGGHAVPPPTGPRWLKGDLHIHTNHSDARWTVDDIVAYAAQHRLDFLAITDHNTVSSIDEVGEALRLAGSRAVVIAGMELTTFWGHANALGIRDWIDWRVRAPDGPAGAPVMTESGEAGAGAPGRRTMSDAAGEVHRRSGIFVVNHPRAAGYPGCTGCRWEYDESSARYADAIEVMNGPWPRSQNAAALDLWDAWLSSGLRLPATAGSDSHGVARQPAQLGFTYAWAEPAAASILDAVRAGHTYLSRGPSVTWLCPTPGADVGDDTRLAVRVEALPAPADVVLVSGGTRSAPRRHDREGDAWLELDGAERHRHWYRVELYDRRSGELLALTNPVYRAG